MNVRVRLEHTGGPLHAPNHGKPSDCEYSFSPPPCDSGSAFEYYVYMEMMDSERSELLILSIQHESTHAYSSCNALLDEQNDSVFLEPALHLMLRAKASVSWKRTSSF